MSASRKDDCLLRVDEQTVVLAKVKGQNRPKAAPLRDFPLGKNPRHYYQNISGQICHMNKSITTFQAKCANCGQLFEHPSLGDQAYGEMILCSADGKHFAWISAFAELPQRVSALLPGASAMVFWNAIACLADPIASQQLTPRLHCSFCSSDNIEFWEGERIGVMNVPEALFCDVSELPTSELKLRVSESS
jgi:hypothetical protein